jgi:transposase-like protein
METKKCNKCLKTKDVKDFGIESRSKNGYKPRCKDCTNEYYNKLYNSSKKVKSTKKEYNQKYYEENKDLIKVKSSIWAKKNRYKINEKARIWRKSTDYYSRQNEYLKKRYKEDSEYRAYKKLRRLVSRVIESKKQSTLDILGYNVKDLKNHLGRLPELGECLDHKIPLSWFKHNTPPKIANSLMNLQILSNSDNSKKSNTKSDLIPIDYYNICIKWVKNQYKDKVNYE